jgi:hypothetical protein
MQGKRATFWTEKLRIKNGIASEILRFSPSQTGSDERHFLRVCARVFGEIHGIFTAFSSLSGRILRPFLTPESSGKPRDFCKLREATALGTDDRTTSS